VRRKASYPPAQCRIDTHDMPEVDVDRVHSSRDVMSARSIAAPRDRNIQDSSWDMVIWVCPRTVAIRSMVQWQTRKVPTTSRRCWPRP